MRHLNRVWSFIWFFKIEIRFISPDTWSAFSDFNIASQYTDSEALFLFPLVRSCMSVNGLDYG